MTKVGRSDRQETFAGTSVNGGDAPILDLRSTPTEQTSCADSGRQRSEIEPAGFEPLRERRLAAVALCAGVSSASDWFVHVKLSASIIPQLARDAGHTSFGPYGNF